MERAVVLVDMDCFYVQVEQRLNPALKGKPCAVVQYKTYRGGGIIAVGYEARAFGVTRGMMGDDAKKVCPDIEFARVPEVRGKADISRYREAGAEVIEVMSQFSPCVERASIDEAYLDFTKEAERRLKSAASSGRVSLSQIPNTFVEGWSVNDGKQKVEEEEKTREEKDAAMQQCTEDWLSTVFDNEETNSANRLLAMAAVIVEEMRAAIFEQTGFRCSAGIAQNKMLAKLACGFHKPNKQTILPTDSVDTLFSALPLRKIRSLGGKLGQTLTEELGVEMMGELKAFSLQRLQAAFGDKTGHWLHQACRGIELEPVSPRQLAKSIGCSKMFRGKEKLDTKELVEHWVGELAKEVTERLHKDREANKRVAKSLTVYFRYQAEPTSLSGSRGCALLRYDHNKLAQAALTLLTKFNTAPAGQPQWTPPITMLGLSANKFEAEQSATNQNISSMFASVAAHNAATSTQRAASSSVSQVTRQEESAELEQSQLELFAPMSSHSEDAETNFSKHESVNLSSSPSFDMLTSRSDGEVSEISSGITDEGNARESNKNKPETDATSVLSSCNSAPLSAKQEKEKRKSLQFYFTTSKVEKRSVESGSDSNQQDCASKAGKDAKHKGFFAMRQELLTNGHGGKDPLTDYAEKEELANRLSESEGEKEEDRRIIKSSAASEGEREDDSEILDDKFSGASKERNSIQKGFFTSKVISGTSSENISSEHNTANGSQSNSNSTDKKNHSKPNSADRSNHLKPNSTDKKNHSKHNSQERNQSESGSFDCDAGTSERPNSVNPGRETDQKASWNHRLPSEDLMKCDQCGRTLPVWEMPEHSDFHFAVQLQESSDTSAPSVVSEVQSSGSSGATKGKRKLSSSTRGQGAKRGRPRKEGNVNSGSLLSFFSKD